MTDRQSLLPSTSTTSISPSPLAAAKLPSAGFPSEPKGTALSLSELARRLPDSYEPFTDRYFLNTARVLRQEGMNPWVRAQIRIQSGPGTLAGIDEAIAVLAKYSNVASIPVSVRALPEGAPFEKHDTVMTIEAPIDEIVALETMYLGVLAEGVTALNTSSSEPDLAEVERRMRSVVEAAEGRPVIYMGARHRSFRWDAALARAAFLGGASECSTDIGAQSVGKKGVGTIPHVLENIMAYYFGKDQAVVEATKAFDRAMPQEMRRIALIDYNNREIDDAVNSARALNGRLYAVRVDTCGENIAQGALPSADCPAAQQWREQGVPLPPSDAPEARYWYGRGVTVTGVFALRKALDEAGFPEVKIVLSSGFGDPEKVRAFVSASKTLGVELADIFGVGGVFPSWHSKMDVVAVGESRDNLRPIAKAGRGERPNPRLSVVELPKRERLELQ